jgi:hypothetical protein
VHQGRACSRSSSNPTNVLLGRDSKGIEGAEGVKELMGLGSMMQGPALMRLQSRAIAVTASEQQVACSQSHKGQVQYTASWGAEGKLKESKVDTVREALG